MIIQLHSQGRMNNRIWYEIEKDKITATINGVSDTFDFTSMPDGVLEIKDVDGNELIETKLNEVPILSAYKVDGVLYITILFTIDAEEKDERLLLPEPMTLQEFNDLMAEIAERDKEVESDGEDGLEGQ